MELSGGLPGGLDPGTYHRGFLHFPGCQVEVGSRCSRTLPEHDGGRRYPGTPRKRETKLFGARFSGQSELLGAPRATCRPPVQGRRFVGRYGGSYPRGLRRKHPGEQQHHRAYDRRQPGDGPRPHATLTPFSSEGGGVRRNGPSIVASPLSRVSHEDVERRASSVAQPTRTPRARRHRAMGVPDLRRRT